MKISAHRLGDLPAKLAACLLILVCVALGIVGLIVPIVPGLVFLAIAVVIVARHFPWLGRRLRRNRTIGVHLERVDRFLDLRFWSKVQVAGLICAKLLLDGLALVSALVTRRVGQRRTGFRGAGS